MVMKIPFKEDQKAGYHGDVRDLKYSLSDEDFSLLRIYLMDILHGESGKSLLKLWNIGSQEGACVISSGRIFQAGLLQEILQKRNLANLSITMNTYQKDSDRFSKMNIHAIKSFAIDIDYRQNEALKDKDPQTIKQWLMSENFLGLPWPNWIETGHQLRLIYVLYKPVFNRKRKKNLFVLIERIMKVMCQKINEEFDLYAEPQKLTSFLRLPGSINTKGMEMVRVERTNTKKYTLDYYVEEILPALPAWYRGWKKRKRNTKRRKKALKNLEMHNRQVLEDLKAYQTFLNKKRIMTGHREVMCWIYCKYCYLISGDQEDAVEKAVKFNKGFLCPLIERQLRFDIRTTDPMPLRNQTILDQLGIDDVIKKEAGIKIGENVRKKECQKRYDQKKRRKKFKKGEYKCQKMKNQKEKIYTLYNQGFTQTAIGEKLGISRKTVYNYLRMKKEELRKQEEMIRRLRAALKGEKKVGRPEVITRLNSAAKKYEVWKQRLEMLEHRFHESSGEVLLPSSLKRHKKRRKKIWRPKIFYW
ncbi:MULTISPECIES: terminase gpP N-terminus-related DNA-binding protein [Anaerostipes]|nr:hypothetical protein [Anaerostipes hominis (ex Lee et al. 2021)]